MFNMTLMLILKAHAYSAVAVIFRRHPPNTIGGKVKMAHCGKLILNPNTGNIDTISCTPIYTGVHMLSMFEARDIKDIFNVALYTYILEYKHNKTTDRSGGC